MSERAPSRLWLWLKQVPAGPIAVAVLVAAVGVGAILYQADALPELWVAVGLALLVAGFCAGAMLRAMLAVTGGWGATALAVVLGATVLILALIPVWITIIPGQPLAKGALENAGDTLALPPEARGPVRILVHGGVGGQGNTSVRFRFGGATDAVKGKLARSTNNVRVGRRGRAQVEHLHDTEYLAATIPPDGRRLVLAEIDGPLVGQLAVAVYPGRWPLSWVVVSDLLALVAVALVSAWWRLGAPPPAFCGVALSFGAVAYSLATPTEAVRNELGALMLGGPAGLLAGGLIAWAATRVIAGRASSRIYDGG